jgi:hypothetical protein
MLQRTIVQLITAVENHALDCNSLGQVLCCLGFPGAGRPCRSSSQVEMVRTEKRAVAAIGERGDYEPRRVAQILVAIVRKCIQHAHDDSVPFPVVPAQQQGAGHGPHLSITLTASRAHPGFDMGHSRTLQSTLSPGSLLQCRGDRADRSRSTDCAAGMHGPG